MAASAASGAGDEPRILLVDGDSYTRSLIAGMLAERGFRNVGVVTHTAQLPEAVADAAPDVLIVNHLFGQSASLAACAAAKALAPHCAALVLVSPGPALAVVRAWQEQTGSIDAIVEKPLSDSRFRVALSGLLEARRAARDARSREARMSNLLSDAEMTAAAQSNGAQAELFEAAVLFTDVRGSSGLITSTPPRQFFDLLNEALSVQSRQIHAGQGTVIKFTGDGLLAIFRGMGHSFLALRCGLELAAMGRAGKLPYGVGIAQGLVLAGLIGDASGQGQKRRYDVIGATVHLAARLCAMAGTGELVATRGMNAGARISQPQPRPMEKVSVRGFPHAIDCIAFTPTHQPSGDTP